MLRHLHIRNFAIVPRLEQDFDGGFTAISGETGAGKSILVDALSLLLGARSDSGWVKPGADRAELNAEFSVADNSPARAWLAEQALDEDGSCLLRRTIASGGRSRAWINGTPVTVQQLSALGNLLVEIHGQNEHIRLTGAARQREMLDETGDHGEALDATTAAFEQWRDLHERFQEMEQAAAISPGELEFLQFQHNELEEAAISATAVTELEQEHRLLAGSESLLEALSQVDQLITSEQNSLSGGLGKAVALLEPHRTLGKEIDDAARMLEEARVNVDESLLSIQSAQQRVDLSPEKLALAERQLSELNTLARKHQVRMEELEGVRDELAIRLHCAERFEQDREGLEKELATALAGYRKASASLSKHRLRHGGSLSFAIEERMEELGMPGGRFVVNIQHDPEATPTSHGSDHVSIEISANPGMPPGPLAKVASGGELSRISLAIKVACSDGQQGRTQVFDEVDAGIGGDTANAVGKLLRKLATGGQALCVTHLAQVAVRANHQLAVSKDIDDEGTAVDARVLAENDRIEEIARMLGGKLSEQSRAHAQEMLEAASGPLH